jgi:hypothetical protein
MHKSLEFPDTTVIIELIEVAGDNDYAGSQSNLRVYKGSMSFKVLSALPEHIGVLYDTLSRIMSDGFMGLTVGINPHIDTWKVRYQLTDEERTDDVTCVLTVSYRSFVGGDYS